MDARAAVDTLVAASLQDKSVSGPVYVQVVLNEPAVSERQHHPILLPMPHKFRRRDELMTCLVVKDPSHHVSQELSRSEKTAQLFDEVIGVGKLRRRLTNGRKSDKTTKAAEKFVKDFTLIFVHEKVRDPLVEVLGLGYYKRARHLPIPVTFSIENAKSVAELRMMVKAAFQSAQLILKPESKSVSIRVGHTKMAAQKLAENIDAAIRLCKHRIPRGQGAASVYYIKTPDSLALKVE